MRLSSWVAMALGAALMATPAAGQTLFPTPGCKATPAEMEQTR
jgi:hypothetical protein